VGDRITSICVECTSLNIGHMISEASFIRCGKRSSQENQGRVGRVGTEEWDNKLGCPRSEYSQKYEYISESFISWKDLHALAVTAKGEAVGRAAAGNSLDFDRATRAGVGTLGQESNGREGQDGKSGDELHDGYRRRCCWTRLGRGGFGGLMRKKSGMRIRLQGIYTFLVLVGKSQRQ